MAKDTHHEMVEVDAHGEHHADGGASIITPEATMLILTWVTFFILLGILKKFAFKPILAALDQREQKIRQSLEDADKAAQELADMQKTKEQVISDAKSEARQVVDEARQQALASAQAIGEKARLQAQETLDQAKHDIELAKEKAVTELRQVSVDLAVDLASKIMDEKLDAKKNEALIDKALKEIT